MPRLWRTSFIVSLALTAALAFQFEQTSQGISGYMVNGTISHDGCLAINGTISNQTTPTYPIQVCQYKNSFFQIRQPTPNLACSQPATSWKDPTSGQVFNFSGPCDRPQFYSQALYNVTFAQPLTPNPPLQQVRQYGIPAQDVTCPQGMVLMKRSFDNSPACVKPDTAQKLVERGWGAVVTTPTPNVPSRTAIYTAGQKVGAFTILAINPGNVTGYYNSPYPIQHPGPGVFTTMRIGDTLNPTCDGSAPLVISAINYPNSITVTAGSPTTPRPGGCPICLSADSTIATPSGEVDITDVKQGTIVWSIDSNGDMVKSKVIKTNRVFVGSTHEVIDMRLKDGRELLASPNHPTYDGRTISDLKVGEKYDGSTIRSMDLVHYKYQYTYDILPSSTTGDYFADSILVGSTLK